MILQNHRFLADCQSMFSHSIFDKSSLLQRDTFLVLGGGLSGESAGRLLTKNGKTVYLADKNAVQKTDSVFVATFSDTTEWKELPKFQMIIKSPGISPEHPLLTQAEQKGIPILSEIYLGRLFFNGTLIGITGTDGKSTTTALTHHIIKAKFPNSEVGGNLGLPFTSFCDENLDLIVLELSSYQLEDSPNLKLTASAIITLAPDHLERHKTMERYAKAKWNIVSHNDIHHTLVTQKKVMELIPKERTEFMGRMLFFGISESIDIRDKEKLIKTPNGVYHTNDFNLPGFHNLQNLSVAIALAETVGLTQEEIQGRISTFQGLPHRFQSIPREEYDETTFGKIRFINDSKSTNLHSMLSGIAGYAKEDPIFLILGGEPKNENLSPLIQRVRELDANILIYGKASVVWRKDFENSGIQNINFVNNLEEAIQQIKLMIDPEKQTTVILSPAAASFDQYQNFSERGDHFVSLVKQYFGR